MPAALLDTNAISDIMMGNASVQDKADNHPDSILTSAIAVGEIQYGLDRLPLGKKRTDLERRAQQVFQCLVIEAATEQTAAGYGRLKAPLERVGLNLGDNDLWIAATALTLGCILVSRDKLFQRIPNLLVEDWSV
ncbi:MAG TPA: PIN domain-containing protein [Gemmataceae bacterium]|jgi:predicted nucleic acid-binding protein